MKSRITRGALSVFGILIVVTLNGCGRKPEETAGPSAEKTPIVEATPLSTIPLPVSNPVVGISLRAVPDNLVVTHNGDNRLELTDSQRRRVLYTFVANDDRNPTAEAPSFDAFESDILGYDGGDIIGRGSNKTALGPARWVAGVYTEDGEVIEKIYLQAPHPSRDGDQLIVTSICPPAAASVDDRLRVLTELLEHVE